MFSVPASIRRKSFSKSNALSMLPPSPSRGPRAARKMRILLIDVGTELMIRVSQTLLRDPRMEVILLYPKDFPVQKLHLEGVLLVIADVSGDDGGIGVDSIRRVRNIEDSEEELERDSELESDYEGNSNPAKTRFVLGIVRDDSALTADDVAALGIDFKITKSFHYEEFNMIITEIQRRMEVGYYSNHSPSTSFEYYDKLEAERKEQIIAQLDVTDIVS